MSGNSAIAFRKSTRPWAVLVCCCLMQAIGFYVPSMMVSTFVKPLITWGLSETAAPLLSYYTVQLLFSIPVLLFSGAMLKKLGASCLIVIGAVACGGSWILFALFPSMPMYYATAALNSLYPLCSLFIIPVLIKNWFYKNIGLWTSLALAFSGVGSFILSPFITDIIINSGWQAAALSMGALLAISLSAVGIFVVRLSPIPLGILPQGATEEDVKKLLEKESEKKSKAEELHLPGVAWREAIKTPAFAFLTVTMLLIGVLSAFNTNVNTLVQSAGYGAVVAGFTMSAAAVGQIIGKPIAGAIKDKFGAGAGNAFGFGLSAIGLCVYIAALYVHSDLVIYAAGFITGTGITVTLNMPALITDDAFGLKDFDTLYSISSSLRALGLAVTNPIVGTILDTSGTYLSGLIIWVAAAVLVIPAAFIAIRFGHKLWKN
ncbi:MFS transporter [Adlercreutzia sp. ZJ473]|uniref:MFS transporter n=1 Tax=Adlercreutzia sp. ZJ473 TaxID=2722822 RepID=UPI0015531E60|nr:MFS transporter [Adlercreutzia sp. ZJ473]